MPRVTMPGEPIRAAEIALREGRRVLLDLDRVDCSLLGEAIRARQAVSTLTGTAGTTPEADGRESALLALLDSAAKDPA